MHEQVERLIALVQEKVPDVKVDVDQPDDRLRPWWINFSAGRELVVVEYRPTSDGFGVSDAAGEGYGVGPDKVVWSVEGAVEEVIKLIGDLTFLRRKKAE